MTSRVKNYKSFVKPDPEGYIGKPDIPFTPTFLGVFILNLEYKLKHGKPHVEEPDPKPLLIKEMAIL